ncbi:MAG: MBL fold metallo-hydrolase [Defluviitaleaceae bacterium]|nr:MBL fold metallo-hydrolase [Defluviitaleaceae bacterium]
MKIVTFNINEYSQNTYIYHNDNMDAVLIDAGLSKEQILKHIVDFKIHAIILTHGHFDHIYSLKDVVALTNVSVYAHVSEKDLLENPNLNMSFSSKVPIIAKADIFIKTGDFIKLPFVEFEVIHTPGHTAGSMCLYDKVNNLLFSGDTLFKESIGRTDLPTSDHNNIIKSLAKLTKLPDETLVYSGHGKSTTIGYEKLHNPYISL